MDKLSIKRQRIFADYVGYTGNIAQFGSMKAAAKVYSDDMETIQGLAAFSSGWTGAVSSGPPSLEDMNGLFYLLTKQLAYIFQAGIPEWSALAEYSIGSIINNAVDTVFMSGIDSNTNNALTDSAKWVNLFGRKVTIISSVGTLPYTVLANDFFILCTTTPTTDNKNVILPTPSVGNKGREVRVKQTGVISATNLYVIAADSSTIDGASSSGINQYTCKKYISDGTNWIVI